MDDSLSHAACGAVCLAQVRLGVSRRTLSQHGTSQGRLQGGYTRAACSRC